MIILQSFAPSPWLQQNTEKCGGSKNALVYKPSGRWPAWWPSPPAETVSVERESVFFFLRWNNHITCPSKYDKCFTKQPFAVNFFKCLWLLALFSSQCMACLISLTTAPFCFGETRQQMTSWSQQGWVSCCDVVRMWNLLTHAGYERNDASHFSRHKRTENTCLSDTRLADFGNAGRGTVVQVRQIATKSCRLFEWLLIGWGKGCASTKILKTLTFM